MLLIIMRINKRWLQKIREEPTGAGGVEIRKVVEPQTILSK